MGGTRLGKWSCLQVKRYEPDVLTTVRALSVALDELSVALLETIERTGSPSEVIRVGMSVTLAASNLFRFHLEHFVFGRFVISPVEPYFLSKRVMADVDAEVILPHVDPSLQGVIRTVSALESEIRVKLGIDPESSGHIR